MRQLRHAAACGLLLTSAGCMQYIVQPPRPSLAGTPQPVEATSYLGGQVQRPAFISADRCRNGEQLGRVLVRRNFGQGLISWLSLGMITPATIVYTCGNAGEPPLGGGDS